MVQNCFNKLSTTLHPGRSQNSPIKLRTIPLAITTELRMKVYVMRDTDMFVRESPFPIPVGILYLWLNAMALICLVNEVNAVTIHHLMSKTRLNFLFEN